MKTRDWMLEGLGWKLGNGSSVRVWGDNWVPSFVSFKPMGPPNQLISTNYRVSEIKKVLPWRDDVKSIGFKLY